MPEEIISKKRDFHWLYFLRQQLYAAKAHFSIYTQKRWLFAPSHLPPKKNKSRPHSVGVCGLVNSNVRQPFGGGASVGEIELAQRGVGMDDVAELSEGGTLANEYGGFVDEL